jgi:hypothetical protein
VGQPQIAVVARDRGGGYPLAAARPLPEATQVADRWHLMENASRAFLEAVRTSMRQIRSIMGMTTVDVALLTAAEWIQYDGYLRPEEANAVILHLRADDIPIKEIVRRTGHSRGLVRPVSSADIPYVDGREVQGPLCRDGVAGRSRLDACFDDGRDPVGRALMSGLSGCGRDRGP